VFKIKGYEIPEMARTARGRSFINLIGLRDGETCVGYLPITDFERGGYFLTFATAQGKVKRSFLKLYQNVNKSGLIAVNLNEGDELVDVACTSGSDHLLLVTAGGMSIRFEEGDARPMGRNSAGVKGIDLQSGDRVVDLVNIELTDKDDPTSYEYPDYDVLTVTENGFGKRTSLTEYLVASEKDDGTFDYRPQSRGGKGRRDIKSTSRNGRSVAALRVRDGEDVVFLTQSGMIVRTMAEEISRIGRNTAGVRLVNVKAGDKVIAAARTEREGE
jgi:DNA gyrase subunit A